MLENIAKTGINREALRTIFSKETKAKLLAERALGFQDTGLSLRSESDWRLLNALGISPQAYFDAILLMENLDTPVGREYAKLLNLLSQTPRYG